MQLWCVAQLTDQRKCVKPDVCAGLFWILVWIFGGWLEWFVDVDVLYMTVNTGAASGLIRLLAWKLMFRSLSECLRHVCIPYLLSLQWILHTVWSSMAPWWMEILHLIHMCLQAGLSHTASLNNIWACMQKREEEKLEQAGKHFCNGYKWRLYFSLNTVCTVRSFQILKNMLIAGSTTVFSSACVASVCSTHFFLVIQLRGSLWSL